MQIVRIGLDLAKYVFEVHGVDARGTAVMRKTLRRDAVPSFFANLPPCLIGMEASNGAHYWARVLSAGENPSRLAAQRCSSRILKPDIRQQLWPPIQNVPKFVAIGRGPYTSTHGTFRTSSAWLAMIDLQKRSSLEVARISTEGRKPARSKTPNIWRVPGTPG